VQKLGGKFSPNRNRLGRHRSAGGKLPRHFRCPVHRAVGGRAGRNRRGQGNLDDALAGFYKRFAKDLRYAEKHMENVKRMEKPTDEKCERCGSPLVIKWGSTDRSTPVVRTIKRIPKAAPSPRKIRSTSPIWIRRIFRKPPRKNIARTAAGSWSSSGAASASLWPAPAIPIARRLGASIKARRSRTSA